jgi:hypothetical protein
MTHSYRILRNSGDLRIASEGEIFAEDELCEAIWLVNKELRSLGLTLLERIEAERQIARYGELLAALREAGA